MTREEYDKYTDTNKFVYQIFVDEFRYMYTDPISKRVIENYIEDGIEKIDNGPFESNGLIFAFCTEDMIPLTKVKVLKAYEINFPMHRDKLSLLSDKLKDDLNNELEARLQDLRSEPENDTSEETVKVVQRYSDALIELMGGVRSLHQTYLSQEENRGE